MGDYTLGQLINESELVNAVCILAKWEKSTANISQFTFGKMPFFGTISSIFVNKIFLYANTLRDSHKKKKGKDGCYSDLVAAATEYGMTMLSMS